MENVQGRPLMGAGFSFAVTSGTIAAALAAGAVLFSARWSDTTRLAVLHRLRVKFQPLTLFTAAQLVDFGFDAFVGRTFTAANTGGTALTLAGNSMKKRAASPPTLFNDIRIATTAALGGGAVVSDAHPFAASIGDQQRVNPAAATEEQYGTLPLIDWWPDIASGEGPIILAQDEGIQVKNRTVWPAAGTGIIQVEMAWAEVSTY